ncbi:hypothetical protein ISCGN_023427 [Ixodes scapularis]
MHSATFRSSTRFFVRSKPSIGGTGARQGEQLQVPPLPPLYHSRQAVELAYLGGTAGLPCAPLPCTTFNNAAPHAVPDPTAFSAAYSNPPPVAKPFECHYCRRSFSRKITLIRHARTHTGEKPYQCGVCWRPFARKSALVAHVGRHAGAQR